MANRFIDWLTGLTAKSTAIDGSEIVHVGSSGLSQKALLSDVIRYGGGNSTRVTTIGNANIHQKSDGTMWLEVTGQTAGNARGAGAFDWQSLRGSAGRIAQGNYSACLNADNTATGIYATAIGNRNIAAAEASFVAGGYSGTTSTAKWACAFGLGLSSYNIAQVSFGYGTSGAQQANIQTAIISTTDASATVMNITGSGSPGTTDMIVIPAMRACAITGLVTAMSDATDGYKVKAWEIKAIITRDNSNNTRIVDTPIIVELGADTEADGWAITSITADNTNESLSINVTGEAATNIRWQASLFYGQVGF